MEVAEIVAIDARKEPRFNPENRFFDSKEILVICSSLVSVFTENRNAISEWTIPRRESRYADRYVLCIKLAHFSVKEYLTSFDIRNGPAEMYAITRELANTSIAESCLAMLLHLDKRGSLTSLPPPRAKSLIKELEEKFPLAEYAAKHWLKHAHDAGWDSDTGGLVSEIFLKRDALENWIRLGQPEEPWEREPDMSKSSNDIGPSIYYASQAGLLKPLKILIEAGADVNAPGGYYGNALQAASYEGHREVIDVLLDKGADVNVHGGRFGTALQAAACNGHKEIVHILLDAGADVDVP